MSALDDLKDRIDSAIYTNTEQNITGDGLQTVLDDMVDTMGVSVSQNTDTGHTDISVGGVTTPVASVEELNTGKLAQFVGFRYNTIKGFIVSSTVYNRSEGNTSILVRVQVGDKILIKKKEGVSYVQSYTLLSDYADTDYSPQYAEGYTGAVELTEPETRFTIEEGTKYLVITNSVNGQSREVGGVYSNGLDINTLFPNPQVEAIDEFVNRKKSILENFILNGSSFYRRIGDESYLIEVKEGDAVEFELAEGILSSFALLSDYSDDDASPQYSQGMTVAMEAFESTSVIIESGTKYLVVTKSVQGSTRLPKDIYINGHSITSVLPNNRKLNGVSEYVGYPNCSIKDIKIDGAGFNRSSGGKSLIVPINSGDVVTFKTGTASSYFVMLSDYTDYDATPQYATGYSSYGVLITDNTTATAPSNAKYLVVLLNVGGTSDRTPDGIYINGGINLSDFVKTNLSKKIKDIDDCIVNYLGFRASEEKPFRIAGDGFHRNDGSKSLLIRVTAGDVVTFKKSENTSYFLMLSNYTDTDVTVQYATGYSSYGVEVTDSVSATAPADAKFLVVLTNVGGTSDRTPDGVYINGYGYNSIIPDGVNYIRDIQNNLQGQIDDINIKVQNNSLIKDNSGYANGALKWMAIGDSYTQIDDYPGATIQARIGGKGYMKRTLEQIPQLQYTNKGYSGETFIDWGNRLNEIVGGYDLYTIMLGTNDWSQSVDWGTISDFTNRTTGKSLGCFGKIIDKIKSVAPNAKIVVLTQIHRTVGIVPGQTVIASRNHDTYLPNSLGLYFADMEKDIIDCCKLEDIEYVDVFTESGVTPRNACKFAKVNTGSEWEYLRYPDYLQYIQYDVETQNPYDATTLWVTYDGVHPSMIGMQIIANLLAAKLNKYLFT